VVDSETRSGRAGKGVWGFFGLFLFACLLFWWLPSILFRFLGLDDPMQNWTLWVSFLGVVTFATGYFLPPIRFRGLLSPRLLDACETIAHRATIWLTMPALTLAVQFYFSRSGLAYGEGDGISIVHQAVLYTHMFFAFLFLGAARAIPADRRRILLVSILAIAPRLIVSLRWGRFFLAQAIVPIIFIALARGWMRLSGKRLLQLGLVGVFIIFVPSLTRGDKFIGQDEILTFFQAGSTLRLFQDNLDLNLAQRCPPLIVSMTAKVIPYGLLGVCTIESPRLKGMPATLDRILTENDPSSDITGGGTGSIYLLELYLTGGFVAVVVGSMFFGFTSRCFVYWIGERSVFAGIWAECLSRALFAPRSTLGYVYERIPSLLLVTLLIVCVAAIASAASLVRSAVASPVTVCREEL
jgi:hypothetical protein